MSAPEPVTLDSADREAAHWMARLQNPVVTQADLRALRAWRRTQENDRAFLRQEKLWREAAGLRRDPDVREASAAVTDSTTRRKAWTQWAGAAAAATALTVIAFIILASSGQTYVTARAQRMQLRLADGSLVDLDADSRLRVRIGAHRRDLQLERGQALFDVAHDPTRPFTVQAGAARATAVGTRFDVRRLDAGARIALLQGRLAVEDGSVRQRWTLEAGQQLSTGRSSASLRPRALDADLVLGWTHGSLVFRDTPLKDAVAEANRYATIPLVLENAAGIETLKVDGVFQAGDSRAFAQALSTLYGLRLRDEAHGRFVLSPAAPPTTPAA